MKQLARKGEEQNKKEEEQRKKEEEWSNKEQQEGLLRNEGK